jgi:signal peptidase I
MVEEVFSMRLATARKRWLTVFLSLIMPGLGQIYCGELLRGVCFLILFIFSPLLLARITVLLPDGWMLTGMGLAITFGLAGYLVALADSWRLARECGDYYELRKFNNPVFYLAVWLVGTVLMLHSDQYLKDNAMEAYKIVGKSMEPQVLQGDYVLVRKPAYRNRALQKGDIVIAVYPDDRSKVLIRRIEGLPGEVLTREDGSSITVPHGTVMIKGTGKHAIDSSTFGPLDMRDIVGRVTQIYFSRDGGTIRWGRIGTLVN